MFDFTRFQLWHAVFVLIVLLIGAVMLVPIPPAVQVVEHAHTTVGGPKDPTTHTAEADLLDASTPDTELSSDEVKALSVALVYEGIEGQQDHAFVDMAVAGAQQARADLRVDFKETRIRNEKGREAALTHLAEAGTKLIISLGYQNVSIVGRIARDYPTTKFVVIDGLVPNPYANVQSVLFKDNEGAFLVGVLAGYLTKNNHVAFVGGVDVPLIRNFFIGFEQGVRYVEPNITVTAKSVGSLEDDTSPWNNPDKAYKIATQLYTEDGADIIFAAAGGSSIGVLKAAKEQGHYAIGVDTNQNSLYPGTVISSMVKRVDRAVYNAITDAKEGVWQPGVKYLGVKENALDYAVDENNKALVTKGMIQNLEEIKDQIIRGTLVVDSYQN